MWITNEHLSKRLFVTPHAQERWAERHDGRDLTEALAAALPFGGQKGTAIMLKAGDAVFVVEQDAIATCLTEKQAMANISRHPGMRRTPKPLPRLAAMPQSMAAPTPFSGGLVEPAPEKSEFAREFETLSALMGNLGNHPLDVLSGMFVDCERLRGGCSGKSYKRLGTWMLVLQNEIARRREDCRRKRHIDMQTLDIRSFKLAMKELLDESTLQAIRERAAEIRQTLEGELKDDESITGPDHATTDIAASGEQVTAPAE